MSTAARVYTGIVELATLRTLQFLTVITAPLILCLVLNAIACFFLRQTQKHLSIRAAEVIDRICPLHF